MQGLELQGHAVGLDDWIARLLVWGTWFLNVSLFFLLIVLWTETWKLGNCLRSWPIEVLMDGSM